jgi:1-phosphofructokinase family hexose kinase
MLEPMLPPTRLATVTLNGTLDRVILISHLSPGAIYDTQDVLTLAGGKGLNVARAARALGSEVMAAGLVAGYCGEWICALLAREGIPGHLIRLPAGESRISTMVVDLERGQTTVLNDLGPPVDPGTWPGLRARLSSAVEGYPWVVLAGGSLPGLPDTVYAELCVDIQARGQRICLDARDAWLQSALAARPYLVKCNQFEAAKELGRAVDTPHEARQAAQAWIELGVTRVVLTLGRQGAVAVEGGRAWYVQAPHIEARYLIGSGDAMMAGLIVALDHGQPLADAARYGVALGAANTLVPGSGRCDLGILPGLLSQTTVREM